MRQLTASTSYSARAVKNYHDGGAVGSPVWHARCLPVGMKTFQASSRPLAAEATATDTGMTPAYPARARRTGRNGVPRPPSIQNSLAARWLRGRRARAGAATLQSASRTLPMMRRWSPGVVPPLVGGVLLACAIFIATRHGPGASASAFLAPATLLKLVVAYLLCGATYGALLYLAASDIVWLCVLLLGAALYAVVTVGVLWGPGAAALCAVLFAALGVWYVRNAAQIIPDGRVLVTGFAGGYARTLYPGRAVLVPLERALATLETGEQRFTCPMQTAEVPNELGEVYVARAAATVTYSLIPSEAHHTLAIGGSWERDLRDLIPRALRQALGEWGAHILMGDEAPPEKLLARTLLRELREQVRPYGIHVNAVGVRDIWLVPEDSLPSLDTAAPMPDTDDSFAVAQPARVPVPLAALRYDAQPAEPDGALPEPRAAVAASEPAEALVPDVLSDAYEAVRAGQINDPATIRQIARAFLRIADDPTLSTEFPYDATAAARILLERAQVVERPR